MRLGITIISFFICMLILHELLDGLGKSGRKTTAFSIWMRPVLHSPSCWLYVAAFLLTVIFAGNAGPLESPESSFAFTLLLAWLSVLMILSRWVVARHD